MESYRFEMLTLEERGELVFRHAEFLISNVGYGSRPNLYAYEQLFIEVVIGHDSQYVESIELVTYDQVSRFLNDIQLPST